MTTRSARPYALPDGHATLAWHCILARIVRRVRIGPSRTRAEAERLVLLRHSSRRITTRRNPKLRTRNSPSLFSVIARFFFFLSLFFSFVCVFLFVFFEGMSVLSSLLPDMFSSFVDSFVYSTTRLITGVGEAAVKEAKNTFGINGWTRYPAEQAGRWMTKYIRIYKKKSMGTRKQRKEGEKVRARRARMALNEVTSPRSLGLASYGRIGWMLRARNSLTWIRIA